MALVQIDYCVISSAKSETLGTVKAGKGHSRHMLCTVGGKDRNINFSQRTSDSALLVINDVGSGFVFSNPVFFFILERRKRKKLNLKLFVNQWPGFYDKRLFSIGILQN